jgi:hypothetical protein
MSFSVLGISKLPRTKTNANQHFITFITYSQKNLFLNYEKGYDLKKAFDFN